MLILVDSISEVNLVMWEKGVKIFNGETRCTSRSRRSRLHIACQHKYGGGKLAPPLKEL